MSKSTSKGATPPRGGLPVGKLIVATLLVGGLAFGGRQLWHYVAPHVLADSQYRVEPQSLILTPRPEWIQSDVAEDVIRTLSIDGPLSVLDDNLLPRLSEAFVLHPWVAKVKRIRKHVPARVEVELVYRQPVCMVEVPGGLYPIDIEAVLLPSADFTPQMARRYPRLSGIATVTGGPVGTRWRDPQVAGAARLASGLMNVWEELKLKQILPSSEAALERNRPGFELLGRDGTRYLWGSAPGEETSGEISAAEKLGQLKQIVGRAATEAPNQLYDLRRGSSVVLKPQATRN